MNRLSEIWEAALGELQLSVTKQNYDTWLKDTVAVSYREDEFLVGANNVFVVEWLQDRLHSLIERTLIKIIGKKVTVKFQVINNAAANIPGQHSPEDKGVLPDRYTFESFVVGKSNEFAYRAAMDIAENPGANFNPLLIYSNPGLGKTHLLHAISQAAKSKGFLTTLVTAEGFTNQYVSAAKNHGLDRFHEAFRSAHILLMDDIQFIQGKPGTQDTLLHIFNDLNEKGNQFVLAADCPPQDMLMLHKRLRSRFQGGLTTFIEPPDYEMRLALLKAKSPENIPAEVLEAICQLDIESIRELEGCLNNVLAYCRYITKDPLTADDAKIALRNMAGNKGITEPSIDRIIEATALYFGISPAIIKSDRRDKVSAQARQIVMFLIRSMKPDYSLKQIGIKLNRDHSTVINGCERVENSPWIVNAFQGLFFYFNISNTFCFEENPETKLTRDGATLKYSANTLTMALLAFPSLGGSLTETMKFISSSFFIFSCLADGLTFTNTFIIFYKSGD